jgi:polyisoprenoid-binding protein YceI
MSNPNDWSVDLAKGDGHVDFFATGRPAMLKIHGSGEAPRGKFVIRGTTASGTVTFALASLATGISLRDEHLKDKYLETGKYPTASLKISGLAVPGAVPNGNFKAENVPFSGPLTLHGVTRPVNGTVNITREGSTVSVTADFELKIADYGIAVPSFSGITVADVVRIEVESRTPVPASR